MIDFFASLGHLSHIGLGLIAIGLLFFFLIRIYRFRNKNVSIATRKTQNGKNELAIIRIGSLFAVTGLALIIFDLFPKSKPTDNSWIGNWTAHLEELGSMEYSQSGTYTIEFSKKPEDGKIIGTVFNEKGREHGHLSRIEFSNQQGYSYMRGKMGNLDGRKLEFEFMMFPDKKTFLGRYRLRNTNDDWSLWVSHRM